MGAQLLSDLFTNRKENISLTFSEDCLYLNVYTPADLTKRSRLPVSGGNPWSRLVWTGGDEGVNGVGRESGAKGSSGAPGLSFPPQPNLTSGSAVCPHVCPLGQSWAPGGDGCTPVVHI